MKSDEASMTARLCAASRGAHLRLDKAPHVLNDIYAEALSGFTKRQLDDCSVEQLAQFRSASTRATMSVRSRIVEDAVAENAKRGALQYVIFGAGLDSFALRRPEQLAHVDVFEVDHIATQAWKQKRIAEHGIEVPANLTFVDVNFETEQFEEKLVQSGLQRDVPTVFSLLGVSQYISEVAFLDLAKRAVELITDRSEFIMNFIPPVETLPAASADAVRSIAAKSATGGEPFVSYYTADQLATHLRDAGFLTVSHLSPEYIRRRYFDGRADGLTVGNVINLIRASTD
jgi:methyltransferase (TIGR00027 family)